MGTSSTLTATPRTLLQEVELLRKLIEGDGVTLLLDARGQPFAVVSIDGQLSHHPIDSVRFEDLLISLFFSDTETFPSRQSLQYARRLIREDCRRGARKLAEFECEDFEENLLVHVLVAVVQTCGSDFEVATSELHRLVSERADRRGIWSFDISPFVNVFARRLRRLSCELAAVGLRVDFTHREDGSYCRVTRTDAWKPEGTEGSSADPSVDASARQVGVNAPIPSAEGTDDTDGSNTVSEGGDA